MNFASSVAMHARSDPDAPALLFEGTTLTYEELDGRSSAFANLLVSLGVDDGDRVALYVPNVPAMVAGYLGCLKRGAIPVPVNQRYTQRELEYVLGDLEPRTLLTVPELVEDVPPLSDGPLETVLLAETTEANFAGDGQSMKLLSDALSSQSRTYDPAPKLNEAVANVMYTSGSTGNPKPVIHQHGFHHAVAGGRLSFFGLSRSDIALITSPLFHISGLGVLDMALSAGSPVVLLREWNPDAFLAATAEHSVTYTHLITTVLLELVERDSEFLDAYDTDSLRIVLTGGGSMSPEHLRQFEDHVGGTVCEGYGRTEGGFAYNRPDNRSLESNGTPLYDINDLRIVDPDSGMLCEPGVTGEIQVRGEGVSVGYFERSDLTSTVFVDDEWMHTGDLGWMDEEGFLHFVGRVDGMIKSGGENVSPAEVETVLNDVDGISEAAVVGLPDEKWGERVAAAIVRSDEGVTRSTIERHSREQLAGFKIPRVVAFVTSLPKQGSGKLDRSRIKELVDERSDDR